MIKRFLFFLIFCFIPLLHAEDSCTSPTATVTLNQTLTSLEITDPYITDNPDYGEALFLKIVLPQNGQLKLVSQQDSANPSDTVNTFGQLLDENCALLTTDTQTFADPRYFQIDENLSAGTYYLRVYNEVTLDDSDPSLAKGFFQLSNIFTAQQEEKDIHFWRDHPSSITSGEDIVYHVNVKNYGTLATAGIVVTVPDFTDYLTYVEVENAADWSCTKNSTDLVCTHSTGVLNQGELSSFDIKYHSSYETTDHTVSNQAHAEITYSDTTVIDRYNTRDLLIKKQTPSISITKTATKTNSDTTISSIVQGSSFDYKISVTNNGTLADNSVSLEDTVPSAYTLDSVSSSDFSCSTDAQQVDCTLPNPLEVGETKSLRIHVTATDSSGAINTASVSASTLAGNVTDTDNAYVDIDPQTYQLSITKTADTSELVQGHTTSYHLKVTNTGNMPLTNVTLTDTVPSQLSIVSIDNASEWDCSASDTSNNQLSCLLNSTLQPGYTTSLSMTVKGETVGSSIVNTASSGATSATTVSDSASLNIVAPQPEVTIDKSAPATVDSMEKFYYSFNVANTGTETLSNITVTDTFDAQLTLPDDWNDAVPASWSCSKSDNTITCNYSDTLSEDAASALLKIKVQAPFTEDNITIDNTALVSAYYNASDTVTDTDTAQIAVSEITRGVGIIKSVSQNDLYAGDNFTYTIKISNTGSTVQDNIKVIDEIPSVLGTNFTIQPNSFDCSASHDSHVECTLPSLEAGDSTSFSISFTAPIVTSTITVTNEANVAAHIGIPDHLDEIVSALHSVDITIHPPHSELGISNTASQDIVLEDDVFEFTLSVLNNGIGEENNLTVTDSIPSEFTILSITENSWSCTQTGQDISCTLPKLAPSAITDPIVIEVKAPTSIPLDKSVTNTATVASAQNNSGLSASKNITLLSNYSAINLHVSSNPSSVFAGDLYSYSINLTNNSGKDIDAVWLEDKLPTDVVFDHFSGNGWNCTYADSNRTFSCDNNGTAFKPGDHTIDLYVKAPNYETNVTNTVIMKSSIGTQDQNASALTFVRGRNTHLEFTKALTSKNPVKMNESYSYIFEVTNLADTTQSDINATDLNVTIVLDGNESFQALHATGWNCNGTQTIVCQLPYLEQHSVSSQIVIDVVSPTYGIRTTTASARAKESLQDLNVTLLTTVKEIVDADMVLEVTDTPDPVESESGYSYDFTVTNTHPTKEIEGVTIDINTTSAENFTLQSYSDNAVWTCQENSYNLHCTLSTSVAALSDIHLKLNVKSPSSATDVEINATLYSEYLHDLDISNNSVTESTAVLKTDLTIDTVRDFTRVPIQGDEDTNIYGDIISIGNQSICEKNSAGTCIEPTYPVNDIISQENANLDPVHAGSYQNATAAKLELQPNDKVIWAGLYWMGRVDKTQSGATEKMKKAATVYLRHESEENYKEVLCERSASAIDNNGVTITGIDKFNFINDNSYFDYQGMADVTNYVRLHKGGTYWVANVQTSEGDNISAGWNLVVIVMDTADTPTRELRNITIFDGFQAVWKSPNTMTDKYPDEVNQTVSGFLTPSYGEIDSKFYMFSFEGDKTLDDYIKITDKSGVAHQLTNILNPADDVVNGTISNLGVVTTQRAPALHNTSGIDIDIYALGDVNGSGIIQNAQTSTKITMGSGDGTSSPDGGDQFFLGMFAFSTNLHQPICYTQHYKTADFASDLPAEISLGEKVGIEIEIQNKEVQDIDNLKIYSTIDPVLKENNSSFEIKNIDSSGTLESSYHSDSSLFSFTQIPMTPDQNQTEVQLRAGAGANSTDGGKLYGNKKLYFRYKATIDDLNEDNKTLNIYKASYNPINKKIMIPSCGAKQELPVIKRNNTNGFNITHKNALTDTVLDGYTNANPSQPNNETHLYTQVTQTPFQIDVLALDDVDPKHLRPNPYKGLVELELVEYNSTLSCENYISLEKTDIPFNSAKVVTSTFTASSAQKHAQFRVRYLVDKYGRLLEWGSTTLTLGNLVNVLQDSGYTDICTSSCLGASSTLESCKDCLFKTVDQGGMAKLSCSSDTFAIKPQNVAMDINASTPLKGGKTYALDFDANTTFYDPTITTANGALDFQLIVPAGCSLPAASGNLLTSSLSFNSGKATLSGFKYPNVGKIQLNYRDSIWTYYDQNLTDANMSDCIVNSTSNTPDSNGKIGCDVSGSKIFKFVPEKFTSTATFTPSAGGQVYISNDLSMSGILNLTFIAKLTDNSPATNYTQGCFANDVNFTLSIANTPEDWNHRSNINTATLFDGTGSAPQHLGGGSFKIPESIFTNGTSAPAPVKINYVRKRSVPQNPFIVYKNDFNLSVIDTDGVTGGDFNKSTNQGVKYLYARLYATKIQTDKDSYDVPLYYEAYCKDCNLSKYFPANTYESLDAVNWYIINPIHTTIAQGHIQNIYPKNGTQIGTVTIDTIPISLGTLSAPHRDRIFFKPDPWLQFNKYKENQENSHFDVLFYPPEEKWGGKGDVGRTVDLNISSTNRQTIEW